MNKYIIFIISFLVILFGVVIFFNKTQNIKQKTDSKLQISTSFYPLWFFTTQIAGDKADVYNITPVGAEPHDYEPSTRNMARIENSRILILNGGNFEGWGNRIHENLTGTNVEVIVAGQELFIGQDPHIWLDPTKAVAEAHMVTNGFIKIDPVNSNYYLENEKILDARLSQLDNDYKNGLKNCQKKDFVTSHSAFGYLAARYGLRQVSIAGLSPDAEPSAQQLFDIAGFTKEHGIKYIFFESLVSPKLSQTIANEVGAQILVLDPIEGISDTDIKAGKNYFTIMRDNLKNLKIALECR